VSFATIAVALGLLIAVTFGGASAARHVVARVASATSALDDLKEIDRLLTNAIDEAGKGASVVHRLDQIRRDKLDLVDSEFTQPVDGVKGSVWFRDLDCVDVDIALAKRIEQFGVGRGHADIQITNYLKAAMSCKKALETAVTKATQVSISEDDTWAHNEAIGKSNVCINVRTTPAQASISATLDGPSGYHAHLPKTPLDKPGSIQIKSLITQPGNYTKTLIVYDSTGKETATVTKTFTVAPPPQDGPATNPPCPKPTGGQATFSAAISNPGYDHTTPGNPPSTYPSTVCFNLTTTPAEPGGSYSATIAPGGPAGPSRMITGTLDSTGQALVVFGIPAYGTYTVSATVTASGVQASAGSTTIDAHAPPPNMSRSCAGGQPG